MIGPAWEVEVAEGEGAASALVLESLGVSDVRPLGQGFDKVWLIQGWPDGGSVALQGREFDVATGWLGAPQARRASAIGRDVARELFRLTEAMFAPYAEIGEPSGELVPLRVQGSALPKGQLGQGVAPVGTVFRPVRVFYNPDDSVLNIQKVPYSYLVVATRDGAKTRATLVRGVADPLSKRFPRKNKLVAAPASGRARSRRGSASSSRRTRRRPRATS